MGSSCTLRSSRIRPGGNFARSSTSVSPTIYSPVATYDRHRRATYCSGKSGGASYTTQIDKSSSSCLLEFCCSISFTFLVCICILCTEMQNNFGAAPTAYVSFDGAESSRVIVVSDIQMQFKKIFFACIKEDKDLSRQSRETVLAVLFKRQASMRLPKKAQDLHGHKNQAGSSCSEF